MHRVLTRKQVPKAYLVFISRKLIEIAGIFKPGSGIGNRVLFSYYFGKDMKQYISVKSVAKRYEIGRSTVWYWVKTTKLPKPHKFGDNTSRWDVEELDASDKLVVASIEDR